MWALALVVRAAVHAPPRGARGRRRRGRRGRPARPIAAVARRARARRRARRRRSSSGGKLAAAPTTEATAAAAPDARLRHRRRSTSPTPRRQRRDPRGGPGRRPVRPALDGLVPYEPGKPAETVQRELGLERVVKLASNEGPFGPVPGGARGDRSGRCRSRTATRTAAATGSRDALAERHGVALRGDRRRGRRRRGDRLRLPGDARPRRRGRHALAVVPELRPRSAEARRRPRARRRSPTAGSTSTRCSRP